VLCPPDGWDVHGWRRSYLDPRAMRSFLAAYLTNPTRSLCRSGHNVSSPLGLCPFVPRRAIPRSFTLLRYVSSHAWVVTRRRRPTRATCEAGRRVSPDPPAWGPVVWAGVPFSVSFRYQEPMPSHPSQEMAVSLVISCDRSSALSPLSCFKTRILRILASVGISTPPVCSTG